MGEKGRWQVEECALSQEPHNAKQLAHGVGSLEQW